MVKIKHRDVSTVRSNKAIAQNNKCKLCGSELIKPVLDHNHRNGQIRSVLCWGCNLMLGKIENNRARYQLNDPDKLAVFLSNVSEYLLTGSELIHPTYKKFKN